VPVEQDVAVGREARLGEARHGREIGRAAARRTTLFRRVRARATAVIAPRARVLPPLLAIALAAAGATSTPGPAPEPDAAREDPPAAPAAPPAVVPDDDPRFETTVRGAAEPREPTRRVLEAEEVARAAGTQGDTLKALQNLPGVARAPFGGGALVLRGASPGDSQVFLDGQQIPILYHFGGLRSTFHPRFLEAIDFLPGNFAPDWGRATGGVVNVRVRDPARDGFHGEVGANLYDAGFALEGPLSAGWSVGGAFHRSYVDAILPAVLPDDAPVSFTTAPRYYDYQSIASWDPGGGEKLRLLFYGSLDRLTLLFDEPQSDPAIRGTLRGRVMFHALQAEWTRRVGPLRQESSLQLARQEIDTEIGPEFFFALGVYRIAARSAWAWRPLPRLEARAGLDLRWSWVDIGLNVPDVPREGEPPSPISTAPELGADKRVVLRAPGAFAELRVEALPGLALLPGVRVDHYSAIGRFTVDPRLAVRWRVGDATTLKAGVGRYSQEPDPGESDPDVGTPSLEPLRSLHLSAGVERRLARGVDVDATAFAKRLDRLVVRNPARALDPAAPRYTSDGEGRIHGLELLLRARRGPYGGWLAYTLQRSLREDGFGRAERPFDFDQPHLLTAVASWQGPRGWGLGARFRLASRNPSTPDAGAAYDAVTDP
jgi:hypothetical protein